MSLTTTIISSHGASTSAGSSSTSSTASTLRSLYFRATNSFINRDIPQTHALITSAFQLLPPSPSTITDPGNHLGPWRRKWDILRLTLETTVYSSPPSEAEELPPSIRANLMLSPQSLLGSLHTRSLKLFTPIAESADGDAGSQRALSSRYLPPPVIVTLVLASMKLNAPEVGKGMVEDWLSGRGDPEDAGSEDEDGYEKIIELYCLHLLPRLEEWGLAAEFLQYEGELDTAKKQVRLLISFLVLVDHPETTCRNLSQPSRTSAQMLILPATAQELLRHQRSPRLAPAHDLGHHLPPSLHQANQARRQRPQSPPDSSSQKHRRMLNRTETPGSRLINFPCPPSAPLPPCLVRRIHLGLQHQSQYRHLFPPRRLRMENQNTKCDTPQNPRGRNEIPRHSRIQTLRPRGFLP